MTQNADDSWLLLKSIADRLESPSFFHLVYSRKDDAYTVNLVVYESTCQWGQRSTRSIHLGRFQLPKGASENPWIALRAQPQIILALQLKAQELGHEQAFSEALLDLLFKITDQHPRPSEASVEALLNAVTPLLNWGSA